MMKLGTLKEVETEWNINDVADSFSAMELKSELEKIVSKEK